MRISTLKADLFISSFKKTLIVKLSFIKDVIDLVSISKGLVMIVGNKNQPIIAIH